VIRDQDWKKIEQNAREAVVAVRGEVEWGK
jgi:hypothetical protein